MTTTMNSGIGQTTFKYSEMTASPDIVERQTLHRMWGEVRDLTPLASCVNTVNNRGSFGNMKSIRAKKPVWGLGDYFKETAVIFADLVVGTSTTVSLGTSALGDTSFVKGDLIQVIDSADGQWAIVRIEDDGLNTGVYTIAEISSSADPHTLEHETASVYKISSAALYDDEAREYLNMKPDMISNIMQRQRDTVGSGQWANAEHFLVDMSLGYKVNLAFKAYAVKQNLAMYGNQPATMTASGQDYGIAGGFEYFYNGFGHALSDANVSAGHIASKSYVGQNFVQNTAFSSADIESWIEGLIKYGSKTKVLFGNPTSIRAIYDIYRPTIIINREKVNNLEGLDIDILTAPTIDLPFGRIQLVADYSVGGMVKILTNNVGSTTASNFSSNWVMAVDLTQVARIALETDTGVQTPHIRNIEKINNNSIDKVEIDGTDTLAVGDPRTGGFYSVTAS